MLVDSKIDIKIKLASLWTALMFLYIYADYFQTMTPSHREMVESMQTPNGPLTPGLLLISSVIIMIPALMIMLSIFLKPKINRILNIIMGIIWALLSIMIFFDSISSEWQHFFAFYQVVELVVLSIIIWQAFKWPKIVD
ncbi:hypothetical protein IMCC3317_03470 [Kordia antarctica]|uniref:Uncharacterized protein n=1 Tax=Kordia antarctica TaxID=1218801 RepID=A0A7L4ZEW7_9FLAO|nr:DUF6326 family protein [Kordia antarctica]QHI35001.1 hypothetical protein IMCC3317_03470 [Kordia antarctica]